MPIVTRYQENRGMVEIDAEGRDFARIERKGTLPSARWT